MDVKLKIALGGLDAMAGWAGKKVGVLEYVVAVVLLAPFAWAFFEI